MTNTVIPGVAGTLQPFAQSFCRAFAQGRDLIRVLSDGGWTLSFFGRAPDVGGQSQTRPANMQAPWIVRARPPRQIAESFDIRVEVLFFCTDFQDLQARTVQYCQEVALADARASREVTFIVTADPNPDEKIKQMPSAANVIPLSWGWLQRATAANDVRNPLRSRLQTYLYARDLFDERNPVVGELFFGRTRDLQQLRSATLRDQHVGLFGLRKIGKTSLLKSFLEKLANRAAEGPIILPSYVDLQEVPFEARNWRYLLWSVGRQILNQWNRHPSHTASRLRTRFLDSSWPPSPKLQVSLAFDEELRRLAAQVAQVGELHMPVILDEIELLLPPSDPASGFEGGVEFVRYFRGLTQAGLPLSLVIAGANPYFAEQAVIGELDNPLFNFVTKQYLAPLDEQDTRLMVSRLGKGMGLEFEAAAKDAVYASAGGHPFVTRQLCSTINSHCRHRSRPCVITVQDVNQVLVDFARAQFHTFDQVFDSLHFHPDEQDMLREIATGNEEFVRDYVKNDPRSVEHLKGYGLVEERGGVLRLAIPLFESYLVSTSGHS